MLRKKLCLFVLSLFVFSQMNLLAEAVAPPPPPPPVSEPAFTGSSSNHTLLLSRGGTLSAWGSNEYGQCGFEGAAVTTENAYVIPHFANIVQVALGETHSLALDEDGKVWSWGNNRQKQLGRITRTIEQGDVHYSAPDDPTPGIVPDLPEIALIAAGANYSLAIDVDGKVWSWGDNSRDQLGRIGTQAGIIVPKQIDIQEKAKYIAAENNNTLIITETNKIYACGDNTYGQLGNPNVLAPCSDLTIVNLPDMITVHKVAMGSGHAIAYVEDEAGKKSIYAWGNNRAHQLGVDGLEQSALPLEVYTSANITDIFAGNQRNIIKAGTEVWWGTGLNYAKPISENWQYDYSEDVLTIPTERLLYRQIIAIGDTQTIAFNNYNIEASGNSAFINVSLADLSPINEIYYSDLANEPEYTIKLNFIEFAKEAVTITDFEMQTLSGGTIPYVQYINSRECKIKFNKLSFNQNGDITFEPRQSISVSILPDAITTNVKAVTNTVTVWYYGKNNNSIIANNWNPVTINEGAENGSHFFLSLFPERQWASFPFYSMGKTNGINDNWRLGMTFSNLPSGVTVSDVKLSDSRLWAEVILSGNAKIDYDAPQRVDITHLYDSLENNILADIKMSEIDKTKIYATTGQVTFTAIDDPETIQISSGTSIVLGKENGVKIAATIKGGSFETGAAHNPNNWVLVGVQDGVKVSAVELTDSMTAVLTLSGMSSEVYSSDNEVKLLCKGTEYSDSMDYNSMTPVDLQSENSITFTKQTHSSGGSSVTSVIPDANPKGGTVVTGTKLVLTTPYKNGKIYYTTDESKPTTNSTLYTAPIVLDKSMTIKYIVINGGRTSNVGSQTYTVRRPKAQLIDNVSSIRYISGYADGTFKPDQVITRYEMIECLSKLLSIEKIDRVINFTDVSAEYADIVRLFANADIVEGYGDNTFRGDKGLTRAEFAKIIYPLCSAQVKQKSKDMLFTDVKGHWAEEVIVGLYQLGYIKGYDNNKFMPDNLITRAEFVALLNRILGTESSNISTTKYSDLTAEHWAYNNIMVSSIE